MTGFLLPGDALSGDSGRKRVFIHIGLHKTGTSSIQQFLTANRDVLERNRVLYPAGISGGQAHHQFASFFFRPDSDKAFPHFVNKHYGTRMRWEQALRAFRDDLEASLFHSIVFSSERFGVSGCIKERLKAFFEPFETRIVVFIRRQDHWVDSRLNQRRKMKKSFDWKNSPVIRSREMDYYGLLAD
jgi:hypothetical protein